MLVHCRILETKRGMLLEALAAEYERKRRLDLLKRARMGIWYVSPWTTIRLSEEEWLSLMEQEPQPPTVTSADISATESCSHPTLDSRICEAHYRQEARDPRDTSKAHER